MLTGFTTALQLRSIPRFQVDKNNECVLRQRDDFNWSNFILTRIVGLFPMLWLALLFHAPWWYLQDNTTMINPDSTPAEHAPGLPQSQVAAVCTFLYIFGMQSWYQPACFNNGPNQVLYASVIFNQFLGYVVFRLCVIRAQNWMMSWRSKDYVPPYTNAHVLVAQRQLKTTCTDLESGRINTGLQNQSVTNLSWKEFIGNTVTAISYSRSGCVGGLLAVVLSLVYVTPIGTRLFITYCFLNIKVYSFLIGVFFLIIFLVALNSEFMNCINVNFLFSTLD